ncbi:hypothetical protein L1889_04680 [Paenalcaligenes niemegkensis]|uniref:hypothetical protein n=1 Tax=Paenalcaligenes niemegkensis TaxID=2895469 RepID=UPI001EE9545F|nr:hypothetical protein [Paenalcaligenes niemegkensis]MCQ9616086.1 hypothetical protein [Paenalcaligenes niemegkensis]
MTTVTGKFETREAAEVAAETLIQRGYPAHLISIASTDNETGCDIYVHQTDSDSLTLVAPYKRPQPLIGAAVGGLALGGVAAFYFSIGYLHLLWVFAMFGVGSYVGLAFGSMISPSERFRPAPHRLSSSPALIKICTTPHQSSILGSDLKRAGATQIYNHYTV